MTDPPNNRGQTIETRRGHSVKKRKVWPNFQTLACFGWIHRATGATKRKRHEAAVKG